MPLPKEEIQRIFRCIKIYNPTYLYTEFLFLRYEVDDMKNIIMDQQTNISTPAEKKPVPQTPPAPQPDIDLTIKGLKIDNILFCLDTGKEKYLFATEDEAIQQLRKLDKTTINPDNSQIVQVSTTGNTWKLTPVPWSRIAIKLL